jgi:hypothetical protein
VRRCPRNIERPACARPFCQEEGRLGHAVSEPAGSCYCGGRWLTRPARMPPPTPGTALCANAPPQGARGGDGQPRAAAQGDAGHRSGHGGGLWRGGGRGAAGVRVGQARAAEASLLPRRGGAGREGRENPPRSATPPVPQLPAAAKPWWGQGGDQEPRQRGVQHPQDPAGGGDRGAGGALRGGALCEGFWGGAACAVREAAGSRSAAKRAPSLEGHPCVWRSLGQSAPDACARRAARPQAHKAYLDSTEHRTKAFHALQSNDADAARVIEQRSRKLAQLQARPGARAGCCLVASERRGKAVSGVPRRLEPEQDVF